MKILKNFGYDFISNIFFVLFIHPFLETLALSLCAMQIKVKMLKSSILHKQVSFSCTMTNFQFYFYLENQKQVNQIHLTSLSLSTSFLSDIEIFNQCYKRNIIKAIKTITVTWFWFHIHKYLHTMVFIGLLTCDQHWLL